MTTPDDLTSTRAAIEAAERAFSGDIRCSRGGGQTCAKCNDGAECSVCYTQRHGRVLLAEVRRLTDPDMADRLRDLAADLAPFGCRPTMDAVKVLDYARGAIFDLIRERNGTLIEVSRLTDANQRLTDLVRHQRGALHTEGLITDAEYADLAGLTGNPKQLEGYDALRGELALQKRATNVAIGERDAANRDADTYRQILAGKLRRTDLAAAQNGDLMPGPVALASLVLADMIEAKPEAKNRLGWSWTDERTGKGYRVMVEHENGESFAAALATARLDGARAMLDKVREKTAALRVTIGAVAEADTCPDVDMEDEIHDLHLTVDQIDTIDPAAVVGSGS